MWFAIEPKNLLVIKMYVAKVLFYTFGPTIRS